MVNRAINSTPDLNFANDWLNKTREYNNVLTKPREKELLLQRIANLEAGGKGKKYKELEDELKETNKGLRETTDFLKNECGFTNYPHARGLLNGLNVPQILQLIQDKEQTIKDLQGEINNREQEQQDLITLSNEKVQQLEQQKQEQKYQLTQNAKWQAIENTKWRVGLEVKLSNNPLNLSELQINLLVKQWEQVANWATEQGIDINKKWSLNNLKKKLEQELTEANQERLTDGEKNALLLLNDLFGPYKEGTEEKTIIQNQKILAQFKKFTLNDTPNFPEKLVENIKSSAEAFFDCLELLEQQNEQIIQARKLFWQLRTVAETKNLLLDKKEIQQLVKKMRENPIFEEPTT